MSQSQAQNILGAQPYRNPRHAIEAAELEEHEKSLRKPDDQGNPNTEKEVKPEHNWEKRYKDHQSYADKKIKEYEATIAGLQKQSVPRLEAPKTPEELAAFKGKNPEMYAVIQSMAKSMFDTYTADYDQKMADMQGTINVTAKERAELKLKEAHPDFLAIQNSDAFHDWASTQPTQVQDWVYNNPDNADLAIQALSLFKYSSGWGKDNSGTSQNTGNQGGDMLVNTNSRSDSDPGATDRNHPAFMWKESEVARMRPEEFDKWDAHITLAQREGRFLVGQ